MTANASEVPVPPVPDLDTAMFGEDTAQRSIRVLDPKCLPRIETFSGKESEWEEWKFSAVAFLHNLGLGPALKELNNRTSAPQILEMVNGREELANVLYNQLAQLLKGTAKKIAMQCEAGNGFEIWYKLLQRYERPIKGRYQTMLCSLLHPPTWAGCTEMDFEGKLVEWEIAI